ncbi:MAG: hypothetical protein C4306_10540 [Thermoleophilia bacterium]
MVGREELEALSRAAEDVYIDELVRRWIVDLVDTSREIGELSLGASLRGTLALKRAAKAWALPQGWGHVGPTSPAPRPFPSVLVSGVGTFAELGDDPSRGGSPG